jgi:hypothetical protein
MFNNSEMSLGLENYFSGVMKRSNFHEGSNDMNHVPRCSEILHSAHRKFVYSASFSLYTSLVSVMGWWNFVIDTNWILKYSDNYYVAELKSVYCVSGLLVSPTISHFTFMDSPSEV